MVIFWTLLAVGFIACVSIGSIAWYNSKRPAGWEGSERPGWVPGLKEEPQGNEENRS